MTKVGVNVLDCRARVFRFIEIPRKANKIIEGNGKREKGLDQNWKK